MQPTEIFEAAQAQARGLAAATSDAELQRLRAELIAFFDELPEPPLFRRVEDPLRKKAAELLPAGQALLARGISAQRTQEIDKLLPALRAYLEVLCHVAEGRLGAAEEAWRRAGLLQARALTPDREQLGAERPAVFDKKSRVSRFDPREAIEQKVRLLCPTRPCGKEATYSLSPRLALHELSCPHCGAPFVAHVGWVQRAEVSAPLKGLLRYQLQLEEPSGAVSRVELEDGSGAELSIARRDQLALLYTPNHELRGLLNLTSGRILWLERGGPCFVATVAFGEDAHELAAFRAFRDQVLRQSAPGRWLVRVYYRHGPTAARLVASRPKTKALVRSGLKLVHRVLKRALVEPAISSS